MLTEYLTHQIAPGSEDIGNVQTPIYGFRKIPQKGAIKGGSGYTQDMVYIKGHLLNAQVGGLTQEDNLYPITGKANSDHKMAREMGERQRKCKFAKISRVLSSSCGKSYRSNANRY